MLSSAHSSFAVMPSSACLDFIVETDVADLSLEDTVTNLPKIPHKLHHEGSNNSMSQSAEEDVERRKERSLR